MTVKISRFFSLFFRLQRFFKLYKFSIHSAKWKIFTNRKNFSLSFCRLRQQLFVAQLWSFLEGKKKMPKQKIYFNCYWLFDACFREFYLITSARRAQTCINEKQCAEALWGVFGMGFVLFYRVRVGSKSNIYAMECSRHFAVNFQFYFPAYETW